MKWQTDLKKIFLSVWNDKIILEAFKAKKLKKANN